MLAQKDKIIIAGKSILERMCWLDCFVEEILSICKSHSDLFFNLNSIDNEITAAQEIYRLFFEKFHQYHGNKNYDYNVKSATTKIIEELQNYLPGHRAAIIEAAYEQVSSAEKKNKALEDMLPAVIESYKNLDRRTKELFTMMRIIDAAGQESNLDFMNPIFEATIIEPETVRGEKAIEAVVKAYDIAEIILQNR
jgi:predicted nuclease with TOPRIM domain